MPQPQTEADSLNATKLLAEFVANTDGASIPHATLTCIEECLLDFVGNTAYAGRFAESSPAFRAGAGAYGGDAVCTVVGESTKYSPMQAALLNGAFAHTLDFDDTNVFSALHPGASVIPAAIVQAEQGTASGAALVSALALGYEVTCRIGGALGLTAYDRGFHPTAVAGIFGAIAAAARLQELDAAIIANAFGIAGSLACGSMQYLDSGAWNKRLHPGFAAQNALAALSFAKAGVKGATHALEGRFGILTGYSNAPKPHVLCDDLVVRWVGAETAIKPYPSCRLTHGAIDAALALRERVDERERTNADLIVRLAPKAVDIVGEPLEHKVAARSVVDGQFSVYFQVATAWLDGRTDVQSYERLGAADVEAFARRIKVEVDPSLPAAAGCALSVAGRESLGERVELPLGEPTNPLSRERLKKKFYSLAAPVFGEQRCADLAERLLAMRSEPRATRLIASLAA